MDITQHQIASIILVNGMRFGILCILLTLFAAAIITISNRNFSLKGIGDNFFYGSFYGFFLATLTFVWFGAYKLWKLNPEIFIPTAFTVWVAVQVIKISWASGKFDRLIFRDTNDSMD